LDGYSGLDPHEKFVAASKASEVLARYQLALKAAFNLSKPE
jgi:hypothetical protein